MLHWVVWPWACKCCWILTRRPLIKHPLFSALSIDDHSRVRLLVLDGDPHSDYINANYIDVSILMGMGLAAEIWGWQGRFMAFPTLCPGNWPWQGISGALWLLSLICAISIYSRRSATVTWSVKSQDNCSSDPFTPVINLHICSFTVFICSLTRLNVHAFMQQKCKTAYSMLDAMWTRELKMPWPLCLNLRGEISCARQ